jgi:hypothetical protein
VRLPLPFSRAQRVLIAVVRFLIAIPRSITFRDNQAEQGRFDPGASRWRVGHFL